MQIEYKDRKMIIIHPSGQVDEYDEAHLQELRKQQQKSLDDMNQAIVNLDNHITLIRSS